MSDRGIRLTDEPLIAPPIVDVERQEKLSQLARTIDQAEKVLFENSLPAFIRAAWPIIEPGTVYQHNWHIDAIAECIVALRNLEFQLLVINIPPRMMKSIECTVMTPAWWWATYPEFRFMVASYKQDLATKHSLDRRRIVESDWYQARWGFRNGEPWVQLQSDQNEKMKFENTMRGHMMATSFGGSVTGFGGNMLIVDDPHDTESAKSQAERQEQNAFFDLSLSTRFDDPRTARTLAVMQRLNRDDLTGHIEKSGLPFYHLKLPAEAKRKLYVNLPTGKRVVMDEGELLCEERLPKSFLDVQYLKMGSRGYSAQYQQEPTPDEGNIISREWCQQRYQVVPMGVSRTAISVDCAFKDTKKSSRVAIQVWKKWKSRKYLVKRIARRMGYIETKRSLRAVMIEFPEYNECFVEDKANGPAIIEELSKDFSRIIAIEPEGSKEARLSAVAPEFEALNIWLPDNTVDPKIEDYVEELCSVPETDDWDEADATSQLLWRWRMANIGTKATTGKRRSAASSAGSYVS